MVLSATARHRLASLHVELEREFPAVPPDQVRALLEAVVSRLVDVARFDDYIPLLAHRQARERLAVLEGSSHLSHAESLHEVATERLEVMGVGGGRASDSGRTAEPTTAFEAGALRQPTCELSQVRPEADIELDVCGHS
jgi:hypothetical protein